MPDFTVFSVSDDHQDLALTGTGEIESGYLLGTASAPLLPHPLTSFRLLVLPNCVASVDDAPHPLPRNGSPCDTPSDATTDSDASPPDLCARFSDQLGVHFPSRPSYVASRMREPRS